MNYAITAIAPVLIVLVASVQAQSPAAGVTDPTLTGGQIAPPGFPSVRIGDKPAARKGDQTISPAFLGQIPCIGGPISQGSATVLIGGMPAARVGDSIPLACGALDEISGGAFNVLIGD